MPTTRPLPGTDTLFDVHVDPDQLAELDRVFDSARTVDKILARALNDAGRKIRSLVVKRAAKLLPFKQKVIRSRVFLRRAHRKRLFVRITAGRYGWPLYDPKTSRQKPEGVKVKKLGLVPHSFIATMPASGHVGIFLRRGRARLPIDEVYSDSVTELIERLGAGRAILTEAGEVLAKRVAAQAQLVLEGKRSG